MKTRPFCSFPINIWRTKLCKMQGRFQNWVLKCWWKTNPVPWSLPAWWRWEAQPCGEGKLAPLLSSPPANLSSWLLYITLELLPFNTLEQQWIACSQPINSSETKEKHLLLFFLMEAIFWLMAFFCEYAEIAPKMYCSLQHITTCAYCCHFLFSFFLVQK